jgi:hypothetical protein
MEHTGPKLRAAANGHPLCGTESDFPSQRGAARLLEPLCARVVVSFGGSSIGPRRGKASMRAYIAGSREDSLDP